MLKKQLSSIHHSSQPMALHENFSEMDKKTTPFAPAYPAVQKKERTFKVILNSADRLSGGLTNPQFYVQLPDTFLSKRLKIVVESMLIATAPNSSTNLDVYPYMVSIRELRNPYSWESTQKGTHGTILVAQTRNFQNSSSTSTACSTMCDRTLFMRPITIDVTSPYFSVTSANGLTNDWSLVLSIVDEGTD
jgi:hypothetical protein